VAEVIDGLKSCCHLAFPRLRPSPIAFHFGIWLIHRLSKLKCGAEANLVLLPRYLITYLDIDIPS
jgi:hypothetical protein